MSSVRTEIENALANAGATATDTEVTAMVNRVARRHGNDLTGNLIADEVQAQVARHFTEHPFAAWNDAN